MACLKKLDLRWSVGREFKFVDFRVLLEVSLSRREFVEIYGFSIKQIIGSYEPMLLAACS